MSKSVQNLFLIFLIRNEINVTVTFIRPYNLIFNYLPWPFVVKKVQNFPEKAKKSPIFSLFLFQERYRSNSLDSILVTDINNRAAPNDKLPNRHSAVEIKSFQPPPATDRPQFVKKSPPVMTTLEKRPTFEGLDKRKSWSVDIKSMEQQKGIRNARGQTLQQVQQHQLLGTTNKG